MRPLITLNILLFLLISARGQGYILSFEGVGLSNHIDTVRIENLTQGTHLIVSGSELVHLVDQVATTNTLILIQPQLLVYPNPFNNICTIEYVSKSAGTTWIQLFDMKGQSVEKVEYNLPSGAHTFQLSGLSCGMYTIRIQSPTNYYASRLLSLGTPVSDHTINYLGENTAKLNSNIQKSANAENVMYYTAGNLLKITGKSGKYSTIVMDRPSESKTITFDFMACTDADGNNYPVVKIGNQWWMAENLKTTTFSSGKSIPLVEDDSSWKNLATSDKAYCYYENNKEYAHPYGLLYTWSAAMNGEPSSDSNPSHVQGIAPSGWHLPGDREWLDLEMALGMSYDEAWLVGWRGTDEGSAMKSTEGWFSEGNGTNRSGFSALPGGIRDEYGMFHKLGILTQFWSATEYMNMQHLAFNRMLSYDHSGVGWFKAAHFYGYPKTYGFSVRCVRN